MEKDNPFFKDSLEALTAVSKPTDEQKDRILTGILETIEMNSEAQPTIAPSHFKKLLTDYPWRFAFGTAIVQTSVCTLLFGTNYTNFILKILGG